MNEARVRKFSNRAESATWSELTQLEKEIAIQRVIHGLTYDEISDRLKLSRSVVNFYLRTVMRLLRVQDSLRLAYWMGQHSREILGG